MNKIKKFFVDFKQFISKGSVIDLAVGVILATAFTGIITALSNKIIMPLINYLFALSGGGLEEAYTFLSVVKLDDGSIDLAKSIYIDWGAFITAIINFLLIGFVLFCILRIVMNTKNLMNSSNSFIPTRKERKILKKEDVNLKDPKEVKTALLNLRKKDEPVPAPAKPTDNELLSQILIELKESNSKK